MSILLGCIADDFTGATDLASMLVSHGMRTVQTIGIPADSLGDVDAVVVALKSRTVPASHAVAQSLAALSFLQRLGCRQFYFKYCSTFDSTPRGNIGPVADALMDALHTDFTIACPAFPANGRTVYKGHLFVGDVLLSESGMRHHPLTPMTDANLVRVLQAQTPRKVGLCDYGIVAQGARAIVERLAQLRDDGCAYAIVDAIRDPDLAALGEACAASLLVTGGSGAALGLPENFRRQGLLAHDVAAAELPHVEGYRAVISGSCSQATNAQVDVMKQRHPAFHVDPLALANGENVVADALTWARARIVREPVLIYATASPEQVQETQRRLGAEQAGALIEAALADIAKGLVEAGVRRLIVAGGETSGAVVEALGIESLRIGPQIDPGVPWTIALDSAKPLALALKSGNFGKPDMFVSAWDRLP